jgi:hypothetical protein
VRRVWCRERGVVEGVGWSGGLGGRVGVTDGDWVSGRGWAGREGSETGFVGRRVKPWFAVIGGCDWPRPERVSVRLVENAEGRQGVRKAYCSLIIMLFHQ